MYKFLAVLLFVALAAAATRQKRDIFGMSPFGFSDFNGFYDNYPSFRSAEPFGFNPLRSGRSMNLGLLPGEYDLNAFGFPSRYMYTGPYNTQRSHRMIY